MRAGRIFTLLGRLDLHQERVGRLAQAGRVVLVVRIDPADLPLDRGLEGLNRLAALDVNQLVVLVHGLVNLRRLQEGDVAELIDHLAGQADLDRAVVLLPPEAVIFPVDRGLVTEQVLEPVNNLLPHGHTP